MDDIIATYESAAGTLIARYDAFDCAVLYAPVIDLFPASPVRVLDIGAGTGRDAAWFAGQGHAVTAVEPVRAFREAGQNMHRDAGITWIDDRLPHLANVPADAAFDLVTLNGVWQHTDDNARRIAMPRLGAIVAPGGLLVMALRHGPGTDGRRVFPISPADTVALAAAAGFSVVRQVDAASIQPGNIAMGVRWTWLALRRGEPRNAGSKASRAS